MSAARTARNSVRLLRFLREYLARNKFPPSYEEMGAALGVAKANVFRLVGLLERRGLIQRLKYDSGRARNRSISLVRNVKCPSCGATVPLQRIA